MASFEKPEDIPAEIRLMCWAMQVVQLQHFNSLISGARSKGRKPVPGLDVLQRYFKQTAKGGPNDSTFIQTVHQAFQLIDEIEDGEYSGPFLEVIDGGLLQAAQEQLKEDDNDGD